MLKKHEHLNNNEDQSSSSLVLNKAIQLSNDLQGEEQSGSEDQKDFQLPITKKKRVINRKKNESSALRRSIRLKLLSSKS